MCQELQASVQGAKRNAFLRAFRKTGNVRRACDAAGVGRSSHYRWLSEDQAYREAFELAKEDAADRLEEEAIRRAVEGVERPVGWNKGKPGGVIREYSDILLIFLLKGARPEKYAERVEMRGLINRINWDALSDDQLTRLANGEHPLSVLSTARGGEPFLPAETACEDVTDAGGRDGRSGACELGGSNGADPTS